MPVQDEKNKTIWMDLKEGQTILRILSSSSTPLPSHWVDSEKKSHTCFGRDKGCPYSSVRKDFTTGKDRMGHWPSLKYLVWAVDRADNQLKIVKLHYSVPKQISQLKESSTYGFTKDIPYDITIMKVVLPSKKNPSGKEYRHTVMPSAVTPLTEEEVKLKENCTSLSAIVQRMQDKEKAKFDESQKDRVSLTPVMNTKEEEEDDEDDE